MNFLWIDVETTGLNENKQDIIQLACIPIIDGVPQKSFNEFCQPIRWDTIQQEALNIHGITVEQLKTFQTPQEMIAKFIEYVNSFGVKFTIAGYNVGFDKKFMSATFKKLGMTRQFFSMFTINIHDTYKRVKDVKTQIDSKSLKLSALAELYGIDIVAHDALSDIQATIELDKIVAKLIGEDDTIYVPSMNANDVVINVGFPEMAQLHVHSQYNMVDAVPMPDEWYEWAAKNGVPGIAIVDQGSGISLYNSIRNKHDTVAVSGTGLNFMIGEEGPFSLNAWAVSNEGYTNIVQLASKGYETQKEINGLTTPILTLDQVLEHRQGVMFGMADIKGAVGQAVQDGDAAKAEERFKLLHDSFGDKLYVEFNPINITRIFDSSIGLRSIKSNDLVVDGNLGKAYNVFLSKMMDKYPAKAIPVTGACFIDPDDKLLQDCLSKNAHKDNMHFSQDESYHIKKTDQVFKELKVHLGDWLTEDMFNQWVENTHVVTNLAKDIKVEFDYHMPKMDIPEFIEEKTDDYDMQTYYLMMEKIKQHGRWKDDPVYVERFKRELDVIMKNEAMNFIPYFLVYEDIAKFSRDIGCLQSIGRGSAGGCLISYYLKIIHVDPIHADLPFERFLSHARIRAGSWPDIDMDISRTARPQVMKYLKGKYDLGFAQISTLSTMKTKNAIKDAMMAVYGRNRKDFEVDAVCKTIADSPQEVHSEKDFLYGYTDKEGEYHEGEYERNEMLRNFFDTYPDVKDLVDKMLGIVRGWSRHASAFVISTLELRDGRIPTLTMHDNGMGESITVTQYDGKMCENTNMVKADILGLNTMSMVTDCVNLVRDKIDYLVEDSNGMALIYRLPEDDKVYGDFCLKKTDSSFQFNTDVVKNAVQQFMPTERGHLAIMTALLRPGAMDCHFSSNAIVMVEYDNGDVEYYSEEEHKKWLEKLRNQS